MAIFDPYGLYGHNPNVEYPIGDINGVMPPAEQRNRLRNAERAIVEEERKLRKEAKALFWEVIEHVGETAVAKGLDGYFINPMTDASDGYIAIQPIICGDNNPGYLCLDFQARETEDGSYHVDRWATTISDKGHFGIALTATEGAHPVDPYANTEREYFLKISNGAVDDRVHSVYGIVQTTDATVYVPDWNVGMNAKGINERIEAREHLEMTALIIAGVLPDAAIGRDDADFIRRQHLFLA